MAPAVRGAIAQVALPPPGAAHGRHRVRCGVRRPADRRLDRRDHNARSPIEAVALGRPYQQVSFRTRDGLQLPCGYVPSRKRAAVIAFPGRTGPVGQAQMLVCHGCGVLMFDPRGASESHGDYNAYGWHGERDLDAAIKFLLIRNGADAARIGGIGCPSAASSCSRPPRTSRCCAPWSPKARRALDPRAPRRGHPPSDQLSSRPPQPQSSPVACRPRRSPISSAESRPGGVLHLRPATAAR